MLETTDHQSAIIPAHLLEEVLDFIVAHDVDWERHFWGSKGRVGGRIVWCKKEVISSTSS